MRIQFSINCQKALEAVLWVVNKHKNIDVYHLVKVMFYADVYSVNKYGIPVTGDNYLAMKFGTVPDTIYNGFIKQDELCLNTLGLDHIPFKSDKNHILKAEREANTRYLSDSDLESLEEGINEYAHLNFDEVKEKNHSHPAYQKTYKAAPNSTIDWFDIIECEEARQDLLENAAYMVI